MMLCHVLLSQLSPTDFVVTQVQVEDQERLLKAHEHFVKSEARHFASKFVNVFLFQFGTDSRGFSQAFQDPHDWS